MKKISLMLRKCKSLSRQLVSSSSYSNLRSKSCRENVWLDMETEHDTQLDEYDQQLQQQFDIVFVGSTRRRYMINSKHLNHPLLMALMKKSSSSSSSSKQQKSTTDMISIQCEVVLFDHLLWMLENTEPNLLINSDSCLNELAELYACYAFIELGSNQTVDEEEEYQVRIDRLETLLTNPLASYHQAALNPGMETIYGFSQLWICVPVPSSPTSYNPTLREIRVSISLDVL